MKTGYFGRPTEGTYKAKHTIVHILKPNEVCLCGYRPHKTMKFQWCANWVELEYIECKKCINGYLKLLEKNK